MQTSIDRSIQFLLLTFSATVISCNGQEKPKLVSPMNDSAVVKKDTVQKVKVLERTERFDRLSAFLSGMPVTADSLLAKRQNSECWKQHAAAIDSSWHSVKKIRLDKMVAWAGAEFPEQVKSNRTVFYPFSGPDFLNAFILFPNAKQYVMLALEPPGSLPDAGKMREEPVCNYLGNMRTALQDIFGKSYFITRRMNKQLSADKIDGALPVITFFMKMTGNTIINIHRVTIDTLGNGVEVPYDTIIDWHRPRGVRIDFYAGSDTNDVRTAYYFSCDLVNKSFNNETKFYKYLMKMPEVTTYIKSASYCLHDKIFSNVQDMILAKSLFLLEDDTGVPFRFFKPELWNTKLYGVYVKPVSDFNYGFQPDLDKLYKDGKNVKPLEFDLGYHWGNKKDNLMTFTKKK